MWHELWSPHVIKFVPFSMYFYFLIWKMRILIAGPVCLMAIGYKKLLKWVRLSFVICNRGQKAENDENSSRLRSCLPCSQPYIPNCSPETGKNEREIIAARVPMLNNLKLGNGFTRLQQISTSTFHFTLKSMPYLQVSRSNNQRAFT